MRVDEGRNGWSPVAIKTEAFAVVGRGEKSLLSAPGSELHVGREKGNERCDDNRKKYLQHFLSEILYFTPRYY